jgi:F-type H+-transporting ATPase subunit delta
MSITRISSRYAKSILELASERGELDTVLSDMEGMQKAVKNRDLYLLLKSPVVKSDKKLAVFNAIFDGKISKLSSEFFKIIMRKGREQYIPEIAADFIRQYKLQSHVTTIQLTTAHEIEQSIIDGIEQKLLASNATDKSVEIENTVDASLIGGYVLKIGDKLYDDSVKGKLEKLKKAFSKNDYEKAY